MLSHLVSNIPLSTPGQKTLLTPHFVNPGILKRNLALKVGQLANLHVRPVREFVVDQAAPHFTGKSYVAGDRLFWLMLDLLRTLKDRLGYFKDSVQFEGICTYLTETVQELRLNGVEPDHLAGLPNEAKWRDVALIMHEYDSLRKRRSLFDYADAVAELLQRAEPMQLLFIVKHPLSRKEQELVARYDMQMIDPEHAAKSTYTLSGFKVDTPYQEALQTIRNVMVDLRSTAVPVRIGICVPHYNEAYHQIAPVLHEMGQPGLVHFLKGEPLLSTPAGNLWKYFAEWLRNNMSVHRLLRILESSAYDRGHVEPGVFYHALRHFRKSELLLFNTEFLPAFKDYLDGREPVEEDDVREQFETDAATVALRIAATFHSIPTAATLKARLEAVREVFSGSVRIRSEADAAAVTRIEAVLDEIVGSAETIEAHATMSDIAAIITSRLDGMYVNATLPDGTRPVLGTISDLIYFDLDTLYVTGLNEKGPPGTFFENPILLDHEKQLLRERLPHAQFQLREDRLHDDEALFSLMKSCTTGRLVISAPVRDLATGREMLVSRYLLQEFNRYGRRHDDYGTIAQLLGADPRSLNNYIPVNLDETFYNYELGVAAHIKHAGARNPLLADAFPFAEGGSVFRKRRVQAEAFDEYWGVVGSDGKKAFPVMSATQLATWARCPYQFFLKNKLYLSREEDFDARKIDWLDNLAYGNFLHELYYRFSIRLRKRKGEGFTKVDESDRSVLDEEFQLLVEKYRTLHPVTSQFHYEDTVRRLQEDVAGFFERELKNTNQRLFVELSFALRHQGDREPLLKREEPAVIALKDGSQLQVRGAIDRVDRRPDGRYILIDYKSGSDRTPSPGRPFGGGELMQAGLYSEVVGQIDPGIRNPVFAYYYATTRAGFKTYEVDYPARRSHFLAFLTTVINEIRDGRFVPNVSRPDEPPCKFCDYVEVCLKGKHWLGEQLKPRDPNHARFERITREELES